MVIHPGSQTSQLAPHETIQCSLGFHSTITLAEYPFPSEKARELGSKWPWKWNHTPRSLSYKYPGTATWHLKHSASTAGSAAVDADNQRTIRCVTLKPKLPPMDSSVAGQSSGHSSQAIPCQPDSTGYRSKIYIETSHPSPLPSRSHDALAMSRPLGFRRSSPRDPANQSQMAPTQSHPTTLPACGRWLLSRRR